MTMCVPSFSLSKNYIAFQEPLDVMDPIINELAEGRFQKFWDLYWDSIAGAGIAIPLDEEDSLWKEFIYFLDENKIRYKYEPWNDNREENQHLGC